MTPLLIPVQIILVFFLAFVSPARASEAVAWKDLVPKSATINNPLSRLTDDQRYDFDEIMIVRGLSKRELQQSGMADYVKAVREHEKKFAKLGIDLDKLIAEVKAYEKKQAEQSTKVVPELDGKSVRIAGYLLPLEFSGQAVQEFLLVPYMGACVHVPPPPPNQIVFVKLRKPYAPKGLFTPVWVSGKMSAKSQTRDLALSDGTAKIQMGYQMDGDNIADYKQN